MRDRVMAMVAIAGVATVGCWTRPWELPDDSAPPDLAACAPHHTLQAVPLASLTFFNGGIVGAAQRVLVTYPLRACDVRGAVDVIATHQGPDTTCLLIANEWIATRSDCGPPDEETRIVDLTALVPADSAGGKLVVRDGAPGGTLSVEIGVTPPSRGCGFNDQGCLSDCNCNPPGGGPLSCLLPPGSTNDSMCSFACADDADCSSTCACDATTGSCVPRLPKPHTCLDGWRQDALGACRPAQSTAFDQPCGCDADCGPGGVCKANVDLAYCAIPCASDNDCPRAGARCVNSQCT